jgi:hypothetical protein
MPTRRQKTVKRSAYFFIEPETNLSYNTPSSASRTQSAKVHGMNAAQNRFFKLYSNLAQLSYNYHKTLFNISRLYWLKTRHWRFKLLRHLVDKLISPSLRSKASD